MAVKYWTGMAAVYEFDYDTGTHSPVAGEVINVDIVGTESATVLAWTVASGSWAGNDAAGKMWVNACTATFITALENNDNIDDSGDTQICITTGGVTLKTGDWQVAGNWGTGEDPAVPLADDTVIFDGRSVIVPTGGMLDSESGATAQCTFDLLHFKESWAYGVASAAEPLCCSPDKIIIDGSGTYYILCGKDDQSTDTDVDHTFITNPDAIVYMYSNANDGANTCEFTNVYVSDGALYGSFYSVDTDDQGVYITNLFVVPKQTREGDVVIATAKPVVHIAKDCYKVNGTVATVFYVADGTVTTDSMTGAIHFFDGTFNYGTDLTTTPETDMNITALYHYGGDFHWYPDDSSEDATISLLRGFGGNFYANGSTNANRTKFLGGGAGSDVFLYPGYKMNLANGRGNITLTASSQMFNFGGILTLDSGADMTLTYHTI